MANIACLHWRSRGWGVERGLLRGLSIPLCSGYYILVLRLSLNLQLHNEFTAHAHSTTVTQLPYVLYYAIYVHIRKLNKKYYL